MLNSSSAEINSPEVQVVNRDLIKMLLWTDRKLLSIKFTILSTYYVSSQRYYIGFLI